MKGLEPPRLTAQDPKSCAATNYATSASKFAQRYHFLVSGKIICIAFQTISEFTGIFMQGVNFG